MLVTPSSTPTLLTAVAGTLGGLGGFGIAMAMQVSGGVVGYASVVAGVGIGLLAFRAGWLPAAARATGRFFTGGADDRNPAMKTASRRWCAVVWTLLVLTAYLEAAGAGASVVYDVASGLVVAIAMLAWWACDAVARGHALPRGRFAFAALLFPALCIPVYILMTRTWREALWAFAKFAAFFALSLLACVPLVLLS